MNVDNLYNAIGVDWKASPKDITNSYLKLKKQFEQRKDNKFAKERLKEIESAYEILSNPDKRKAYDLDFYKHYVKGNKSKLSKQEVSNTATSINSTNLAKKREPLHHTNNGTMVKTVSKPTAKKETNKVTTKKVKQPSILEQIKNPEPSAPQKKKSKGWLWAIPILGLLVFLAWNVFNLLNEQNIGVAQHQLAQQTSNSSNASINNTTINSNNSAQNSTQTTTNSQSENVAFASNQTGIERNEELTSQATNTQVTELNTPSQNLQNNASIAAATTEQNINQLESKSAQIANNQTNTPKPIRQSKANPAIANEAQGLANATDSKLKTNTTNPVNNNTGSNRTKTNWDNLGNTNKQVKNNYSVNSKGRPNTGFAPYANYFGDNYESPDYKNQLTIRNREDGDAVVCLVEKNSGIIVRNVYIRRGATAKLKKIPNGDYYIKSYYGNNWKADKSFRGVDIKGGFVTHEKFQVYDLPSELFKLEQYTLGKEIHYATYEVTLGKSRLKESKDKIVNASKFFSNL